MAVGLEIAEGAEMDAGPKWAPAPNRRRRSQLPRKRNIHSERSEEIKLSRQRETKPGAKRR